MRVYQLGVIPFALAICFIAPACELEADDPQGGDPGEALPSEIDIDSFAQATAFEALDLSQVSPEFPVAYVELRKQSSDSSTTEFTLVSAFGSKCADAPEPLECESQFAELSGNDIDGFHWTNHPNDMFHYLATTQNGLASAVGRGSDMREFLGTIDNATEALLLAGANDYFWSETEPSEGAIRAVDGGYELIVTQTNLCPIETTGFLLRVSSAGDITIQDSWIVRPDNGFCALGV